MNKEILIRLARKGALAFQEIDNLLETTDEGTERLIQLLKEADNLSIVSREDMLESAYDELAQWSIESDTLILADSGVLICLPEELMKELNLAA